MRVEQEQGSDAQLLVFVVGDALIEPFWQVTPHPSRSSSVFPSHPPSLARCRSRHVVWRCWWRCCGGAVVVGVGFGGYGGGGGGAAAAAGDGGVGPPLVSVGAGAGAFAGFVALCANHSCPRHAYTARPLLARLYTARPFIQARGPRHQPRLPERHGHGAHRSGQHVVSMLPVARPHN